MPTSSPEAPLTDASPRSDAETPSETDTSTSGTGLAVRDQPTDLGPMSDDGGFGEAIPFKALELRIDRKAGAFKLDGGPDRETVFLIPRGCHRGQRFYALPYKPGEPHEPSCTSVDARVAWGFITPAEKDAPETRNCIRCPKRGFGAGHCTDLMHMLAWDIETGAPVMTQFQNAEINERKGVLTLAVNRFRSMGLRPVDSVLKIHFENVANADYKAVVIDVADVRKSSSFDVEKHRDIVETLDVAWNAYEQSRAAEIHMLRQQMAVES